MGYWETQWERIKPQVRLADLLLDLAGKGLAIFGVGVLVAPHVTPAAAWATIGSGIALSAIAKGRYWVRTRSARHG